MILTCDALSVVSRRGIVFISVMTQRTARLYCATAGITPCTAQQRRYIKYTVFMTLSYFRCGRHCIQIANKLCKCTEQAQNHDSMENKDGAFFAAQGLLPSS